MKVHCFATIVLFSLKSFKRKSLFPQVTPRHLRGLRNSQQAENCWRYIFECAPFSKFQSACRLVNKVERYWITGVGCMGLAGYGIDHLLGVSVIRGNKGDASRLPNSLRDPAKTGVHVLASLNGFVEFTRVAKHVRIRKIN